MESQNHCSFPRGLPPPAPASEKAGLSPPVLLRKAGLPPSGPAFEYAKFPPPTRFQKFVSPGLGIIFALRKMTQSPGE
jgi:hypothetical protein